MKKDLGNLLALYPTPVTIVGALVDGKPNWMEVAHVGIIGHDRVTASPATIPTRVSMQLAFAP